MTDRDSMYAAESEHTAGHAGDQPPTRAPLKLMLGISLAQGLALYLLSLAQSNDAWPSGQPILNLPLWTVAVAWPVLVLLSIQSGNMRRTVAGASLFTGLLVLVAIYTGWQMSPADAFPSESIVAVFVLTAAVACFKALMYLQPLAARHAITYDALFGNSWRNFLTTGLAAVMAGAVFLVLTLSAALFNVIGIEFFLDLFQQMWFVFPVIAVAFGLGVFIFRGLARLIDGLTVLLDGLMRLLLPLLITMTAVFLAALPFTGLQPLWEVGSGTALLMGLNALALFFLNAVYQTGRNVPYPLIVHRLVYGGAVLVPIVSGLALYGLSLRIAQYGWTVERCWVLAVCILFALYSCGYAGSILRLRDTWPRNLAPVNRSMGLVVLALMLLANSPLLDFRKIALASQQQRVDSGELELRDFDFFYARDQLGRPAYLWMESLVDQFEESDPELVALIRNPLPPWFQAEFGERGDIWERMIYRPASFEVPEGVRREIDALNGSTRRISRGTDEAAVPVLIEVDLDEDGVMEYVFVSQPLFSRAFQRRDDAWQALRVQFVGAPSPAIGIWAVGTVGAIGPGGFPANGPFDISDPDALRTNLTEGSIETLDPEFKDLRIGELTLRIVER